MVSKPKKAKVLKVRKATQELPKSLKQDKPTTAEALIIFNGNLVEELISHPGWNIVEELIDEGVASVSGRKTNGYYYFGDLERGSRSKDYLTGYQEGLKQFYNRIKDYIRVRDKMLAQKKDDDVQSKAPFINPFMEEE